MRKVEVKESSYIAEVSFRKLHFNSPAGGSFPALQSLTLCITTSNLPYTILFFSRNLEHVSILVSWPFSNDVPHDAISGAASVISTIPTSALQRLFIQIDPARMPWPHFKDSLSSLILRCGPSLTVFVSEIPLSDTAVNHLLQLPHPHTHHGSVLYETGPKNVGATRRSHRRQGLCGRRSRFDGGHIKLYPSMYDAICRSVHPEELRHHRSGELAIRPSVWTPAGVLGRPAQSIGSPLSDHILGKLLVLNAPWASTPHDCRTRAGISTLAASQ